MTTTEHARRSLASGLGTLRKSTGFLRARWWLRSCDVVGPRTRASGRLFVHNQGYMRLGERVQLHAHYAPSVLVTFARGRLEIGDRTVINYGADICATGLVRIGANCLIGTHAIIFDNDFHDLTDRDRRPEPRPIIIGERVWIGNRVTILPGVNIGDGAVIGAGSVVMTDIPARSLAMGNPARVTRKF